MKNFILSIIIFNLISCSGLRNNLDKQTEQPVFEAVISESEKTKTLFPDSLDGMKIYKSVTKMPQFENGNDDLIKYFSKNINYPNYTITDDIQAKIIVSFIIDTLGKVRNESVTKSDFKDAFTLLEKEFLKLLSEMPYWTPGELEGKKVPVRINFPLIICYR